MGLCSNACQSGGGVEQSCLRPEAGAGAETPDFGGTGGLTTSSARDCCLPHSGTCGLGAGRSSGTVSPALSGRVSSPADQTQGDRPGRPPSARRSSIRRFRSMGRSCPPDCCGSWWTPRVAAPGWTQIRPSLPPEVWGEVRAAHPGRGNHARATGRHLREGARRRVARVDEVAPH